jgi:hypothetical protein
MLLFMFGALSHLPYSLLGAEFAGMLSGLAGEVFVTIASMSHSLSFRWSSNS